MAQKRAKPVPTALPLHLGSGEVSMGTSGGTKERVQMRGVVIAGFAIAAIVVWFDWKLNLLIERMSTVGGADAGLGVAPLNGYPTVNETPAASVQCAYPFIYNKPHKTGSSYISTSIRLWAAAVGRDQYRCSGFDHLTAIRLRECLPEREDRCGILNCHIHLMPELRPLIAAKLPGFRVVTSTRYAPHRILSFYMQQRKFITPNESMLPDVKHFLLHEFNPYALVSYHIEAPLQLKTCPLALGDEKNIMAAVAKYDVVVDVTLKQESNSILEKAGLFTFQNSIKRNSRGSSLFPLDNELRDILYNVSCYDRAVHNALLLRMASLYEAATNTSCLRHGRLRRTSSCLHDRLRLVLNDTWIF